MYAAVSDITREVDSAFLWIGGISVVLLLAITALMIYFVFRYSRKRNPKATQIHGSLPLEITWIVIPCIIVLFMFFKGYEGFALMRNVPDDAMTVTVTGQRWFWTFEYPEHRITTPELTVPVNRPVRLNLTAPPDDVVHSLYLPAFRVKEDCVPGKDTHLWFEAEKTGTYNIFCAEYCGRDHSKMISLLNVLTEEEYDAWVKRTIADKNKPVDMAKALDPESPEIVEREGKKIYETYCMSCHGPDGKGGLVEDARNFTTLEGWKQGPKITDIYRTLTLGIDGTQMRPFTNLPPWDRFAAAHEVMRFYQGSGRPVPTPAEIEALRKEYSLDKQVVPRKTIPIEDAMKAIVDEAGEDDEAGESNR